MVIQRHSICTKIQEALPNFCPVYFYSAKNVFEKELAAYKHKNATTQFPVNKPVPLGLIVKITKHAVKASREIEKKKKQKT